MDKLVYLDIVLVGIMLGICGYTDFKDSKIPNIVVIPIALLGLINTAVLFDVTSALTQLGAGIISLLVGLILYKFKWMGAGDVKLIVAMICTIGWEYSMMIVCIGMILGVFYALVKMIANKQKRVMIPLAFVCAISYVLVTGFNFWIIYVSQ